MNAEFQAGGLEAIRRFRFVLRNPNKTRKFAANKTVSGERYTDTLMSPEFINLRRQLKILSRHRKSNPCLGSRTDVLPEYPEQLGAAAMRLDKLAQPLDRLVERGCVTRRTSARCLHTVSLTAAAHAMNASKAR